MVAVGTVFGEVPVWILVVNLFSKICGQFGDWQVRRRAVASGVGQEFPAVEAPVEALIRTSPFLAKWQARGQLVRAPTGQVSSTLGQVACRSGSP